MTRSLTLAAATAVLTLTLAGCSLLAPPIAEPEPAPAEESTAPAPVPTLSDEEIAALFVIPAGVSDQELAEAYVDRKTRWWNFGAAEELADDERRYELGLTDFAQSIADQHADAIAAAWLTSSNTDDTENAIALNANTLAHYIQSLLREEKPYTHTLTLVSLDQYGDNGDVHVLRVTLRERTSDPTEPVNSRDDVQWELHWVVEGDHYKLQDASLAR